MADCIERGPLLEAFKAKCCGDCHRERGRKKYMGANGGADR